ncbi:hypothetical protein AN480_28470 (plasmid) [Mycobacterium intracellulare subsp. chimaera]|nr:hypothetical protein AN480_28470 [Mycobacterium intracellulare subsp. chimaera]
MASGVWPNADMKHDAPPSASAAQHLARALGAAMAETATGQRALAVVSGVAHTTIGRILAGTVLCDIGSLARLEHALGRRLWPEQAGTVTRRRSGGKPTARNRSAV